MPAKTVITSRRMVDILKKLPEKQFLIMDLAPRLLNKDGGVDLTKCIDRQPELNLAITELENYIKASSQLRHTLNCVEGSSKRSGGDRIEELDDDDLDFLEGEE